MNTVRIEKNIFGGKALARIDGKAVFVANAIEGELCEIEITSSKKDYAEAVTTRIIEPSTSRITPQCPNFGKCGGCDYLFTTYENELDIKKNIIIDNASRIGKIKIDANFIKTIHAQRFEYRSHATVKSDGAHSGFYAKSSNIIVPFPETGCLLLSKPLNDAIKSASFSGEFRAAVAENSNVFSFSKNREITESVGEMFFSREVDSFFQSNIFLRGKMSDEVVRLAGDNFERCVDIGCGCGFFTLPLSKKCGKITGFDISQSSIKYAKINAEKNKIINADFRVSDMSKAESFINTCDLIMADPPRSGLDGKVKNSICGSAAKKIIYVSCDASSWARDAAFFNSCGFKLESLAFIDMFPGTYHIELISSFSR